MNRLNSLTIKARSWMNLESYSTEQSKYGIQDSVDICPQIGYRTLWAESYDMDLIKLLLLNDDPSILLKNFKAFIDNGEEETKINENNYTNYLDSIDSWYLTRTGKYDPVEEEMI